MYRREFLAAAVAAAAQPARIPIGFLGVAHSHAAEKLRIAQTSPQWEFAGFAEKDDRIAAKYKNLRRLTGQELLGNRAIKVVAVESEVKPHAGHALAALEAGKHLHLEKPPSDNMRDLRRILDLARRKRLLVQMGYMWRYHPGINAAIEAARKGWLGRVWMVRGTMNTLIGAESRPEWALFHGGQMFEQGGHLIDPMVRLLGRPKKITHFLKHHGEFADSLADNTAAVFEFDNALGIIMSSVLQPGAGPHRSLEIFGSNGNAVVRPIEVPAPKLTIDLAKPAGPYKAGVQDVALPKFQRYVGDFEELAACVSGNRPLAVTPEEDWLVHEALLKASEMWSED